MFKGFQKQTSNKSSQESPKKQDSTTSLNKEKTLNQLEQKKSNLGNVIENYCQRLEQLDLECKGHISTGKKAAAKGCIKEMQSLRSQIEMYHKKINVIIKMTIQLEAINQDQDLANMMEQATSLFRNQEELNDQLTDGLLTWQDAFESQKETDNLFKEMEDKCINNQDIDDTLNKYEQEMKSEKLMQKFNTEPSQMVQSEKLNQPIKQMQPIKQFKQIKQIQVTRAKGDLMVN